MIMRGDYETVGFCAVHIKHTEEVHKQRNITSLHLDFY